MFLRQSIWSTKKIWKEISFNMWKCENFLSSLAYIHRFFLLNISVLSVGVGILAFIAPYHSESILIKANCIDCTCRCIWRVLKIYVSEALARAYKLHVHDFFSVGTFGGLAPPPPPPCKKAGYATVLTGSYLKLIPSWRQDLVMQIFFFFFEKLSRYMYLPFACCELYILYCTCSGGNIKTNINTNVLRYNFE